MGMTNDVDRRRSVNERHVNTSAAVQAEARKRLDRMRLSGLIAADAAGKATRNRIGHGRAFRSCPLPPLWPAPTEDGVALATRSKASDNMGRNDPMRTIYKVVMAGTLAKHCGHVAGGVRASATNGVNFSSAVTVLFR